MATAVPSSAPPKSTVDEPPRLPPVLGARVAAAMKSIALFEGDFPGIAAFAPCVLVFEPEREWVFQCPELARSAGFVDSGARFGATPVFTAKTFTMPGQTAPFEKLKMLVGTAGGVVRFGEGADAHATPFFLVQDLDSLHAHHPAFADTSAEDWTAIFVHELFHVFQFGQPAVAAFVKAWPKAWPQRDVHARFYDDTPDYRDAIRAEIAVLREGLAAPSRATSKAVLARWIAARDRRLRKFAGAFEKTAGAGSMAPTDGFFTFLEGTARYTELRFLCDAAFVRPDMAGDPSFRSFDAFAGCGPTKIAGRDGITRDYHYHLGMLVSAHLDAASPGWTKEVFTESDFLVGTARRASRP